MNYKETCQEAAARELKEETGLSVKHKDLKFFSVSDAIGANYHFVLVHYQIIFTGLEKPTVKAGDDAAALGWYSLEAVKNGTNPPAAELVENTSRVLFDLELPDDWI